MIKRTDLFQNRSFNGQKFFPETIFNFQTLLYDFYQNPGAGDCNIFAMKTLNNVNVQKATGNTDYDFTLLTEAQVICSSRK